MRIGFRNTSTAGNNLRTEMYFDDLRVSELHCTPGEFRLFHDVLSNNALVKVEDDEQTEKIV